MNQSELARATMTGYLAGITAAATDWWPDPAMVKAIMPVAVAGALGGLAMAFFRPTGTGWRVVRITVLGLLVGFFVGAGLHGWKPLLPDGTRILVGGIVGFGAQGLLGKLAHALDKLDLLALAQEWVAWRTGKQPTGGKK